MRFVVSVRIWCGWYATVFLSSITWRRWCNRLRIRLSCRCWWEHMMWLELLGMLVAKEGRRWQCVDGCVGRHGGRRNCIHLRSRAGRISMHVIAEGLTKIAVRHWRRVLMMLERRQGVWLGHRVRRVHRIVMKIRQWRGRSLLWNTSGRRSRDLRSDIGIHGARERV